MTGERQRAANRELLVEDAAGRHAAQTEFERPLLLEAGAGTGKTTTLIHRVLAWSLGAGWLTAAAELAAKSDERRAATPPDRRPGAGRHRRGHLHRGGGGGDGGAGGRGSGARWPPGDSDQLAGFLARRAAADRRPGDRATGGGPAGRHRSSHREHHPRLVPRSAGQSRGRRRPASRLQRRPQRRAHRGGGPRGHRGSDPPAPMPAPIARSRWSGSPASASARTAWRRRWPCWRSALCPPSCWRMIRSRPPSSTPWSTSWTRRSRRCSRRDAARRGVHPPARPAGPRPPPSPAARALAALPSEPLDRAAVLAAALDRHLARQSVRPAQGLAQGQVQQGRRAATWTTPRRCSAPPNGCGRWSPICANCSRGCSTPRAARWRRCSRGRPAAPIAGHRRFRLAAHRSRQALADHPDVRRQIRRGLRQLLVDEFQDTDRVQCDLVRLLALEGQGASPGCSWSATRSSRSTAGAAPTSRPTTASLDDLERAGGGALLAVPQLPLGAADPRRGGSARWRP